MDFGDQTDGNSLQFLEEHGFDVIGIPGSQLSIEGGSSFCVTAPICREA